MTEFLVTLIWLSVSGSILCILLMLFGKLFRGKVSKKCMYYVWLVVLLRLIVPLKSPLQLDFMQVRGQDSVEYSTITAPETDSSVQEEQQVLFPQPQSTGESIPQTIEGSQEKSVDYNKNSYEHAVTYEDEESFSNTEDESNVTERSGVGGETVAAVIFTLWLTAAGISVIRNMSAYVRFLRLVKRTAHELSPVQSEIFRSVCDVKGMKVFTADVPTACLVGIIRPCIYIPNDIADDELLYVLSHELMHYKRRDLYIKWLTEFVITIHWFNPVMYFLRREITRDCELCCDEAVVEHFSKSEKLCYGNMLINAAAAAGNSKLSHFTANVCDGKANIKERLASIMKKNNKTIWTVALGLVLILVLTGCAVALGLKGNENASVSDEATTEETANVLTEKEKSEKAAEEFIKQVMESNATVENDLNSTHVPQETPKPTHEPYEQKIVPFDARLVKTDKDEYTFEELSRGVLLEIDYDLLSEYGIEKYPEDNNEIRWWGQKGTVILKDAQADRVIYPMPNEPGVATITHMADENKGAVRLFAASEDAETVNVAVNFEKGRSYYHISFVKQGKKWVRTFAEPQEAYIREGYKAPEYEYLHREYNAADESWNIWTEKPSDKDREKYIVEERSKIALSREEIADIALRELYNVFGNKFKKVVIAIGYVYDWADVAIYEPDKVKVRNGDCPFYTFEVNAYTGQIDDVTAWIHKDSIPTDLYAKDVFPKNYNKMSPEEIALWFYEHTAYNANKAKIVKTRVVMSDRHSGYVDSVQLFMADGNSYEVGFNQMTEENVPMDIHGIYTGAPTH